MHNSLITCLQLFGIGISFAIAGPCLIGCTPLIAAYILSRQSAGHLAIIDMIIFLFARLSAYVLLGFFAGLSSGVLRQWAGSAASGTLRTIGAAALITLGLIIWLDKQQASGSCRMFCNEKLKRSGLLLAGFTIGIFPCAPLMALLFEITLISNTFWQGMTYALFFGLGTFLSGLIVLGSMLGILSRIPRAAISSKKIQLFFQALCSGLFILMGIRFFLNY